jgi:predicted metal-dependent hydrolase
VTEQLTRSGLTFEVRRSERRKTVGITVDRDGSLLLHAPSTTGDDDLRDAVRDKEVWVYGKLAEKEELLRAWRPKEYVSGESFSYLGRRHRLRLVDDRAAPALRLNQGRFELRRDAQDEAAAHFARWYIGRGRDWLAARTSRFLNRFDINPGRVDVRDLGYRWGSCGRRSLNFHWRVMTLPPRIVDYVIVHELAHVLEPRHGSEFWRLVGRVMPDFEARRAWLVEQGAEC